MKNAATKSICLLMCLVLTLSLLVACGNKNDGVTTTSSAEETVDMPASGDGWIQGLPGYVQVEIEDEELVEFVKGVLGDNTPAGFKGDFSVLSANQITALTNAAESKGYSLVKELDGKYKLYKTVSEDDAVLSKEETVSLVKEALGDKAPSDFSGNIGSLTSEQYSAVKDYAQTKKNYSVNGNTIYKYPVKSPVPGSSTPAAPETRTAYAVTTVKDSSIADKDIEKAILRATGSTTFNGNVDSLSSSQKKTLTDNLRKLGVSQERVNQYWATNFMGFSAPIITITVTVPTTVRTPYTTAGGNHNATVPSNKPHSTSNNSGSAVAITTKPTTRITTINSVRDARNDWVKTHTGSMFNSSTYCKADKNGGIVVGGTTLDITNTGYQVSAGMVVKYSAGGNVLWSHIVGGNDLTAVSDVAELTDGSIIVVGYTLATNFLNIGDAAYKSKGTTEGFVIKYSSEGELLWAKIVGGEGDDHLYSAAATNDGGYVLGGKSTSNALDFSNFSGTIKSFVFKYDSDGNYETGHAMSCSKHTSADSITVSPAGNIFVNYTVSSPTGDFANIPGIATGKYSTVVIKYTSSLSPIWWASLYENSLLQCNAITYSPDGGCVVAGLYRASPKGNSHTLAGFYNGGDAGTSDAFIIKLSSDGKIMWVKPIVGFQNDMVTGIARVAGGYAVCGYSKSSNRDFLQMGNNGDFDSFVYLIGEYGNYISMTSFSGSGADVARSICSDGSGTTYVCGSTTSGDMFFGTCSPNGAAGGVSFVTKLTSTVS